MKLICPHLRLSLMRLIRQSCLERSTKSTLDSQVLKYLEHIQTATSRTKCQSTNVWTCSTPCSTCTSMGLFQARLCQPRTLDGRSKATHTDVDRGQTMAWQSFLIYPRCSPPCCAAPMTIRSADFGGTVLKGTLFLLTSCRQRSCRRTAEQTDVLRLCGHWLMI